MKSQALRTIGLFLVLAFLLSTSGCSASARAERHVQRGDDYYAKSEFSKAKLEYLNAVRKGKQDSRVLSCLGECFLKEGDIGPAYQCLVQARDLQPTNIVARQTVANLLVAFGQTKKAHDEAEEILKIVPNDPQGLSLLALTSTTPEEIASARKRLESIQSSAPNNASVVFALGVLAERLNDIDVAKAYYEKAISLDAKQSRYYLALATLSESRGDTNTADSSFKSAVAFAPIKSWDRIAYAEYLSRTRRSVEAQKFLEQTIAQVPDFNRAINTLTDILLKERKLDEAEKYNAKALAVSSTDRDALINRAQLKLVRGDKAGAFAELQELAATRSKDAVVQYQLALAALANNDSIKARTALDAAVTLDPKHAQSVILRSELQLTKGEVNEAIAELLRISRENPRMTEPLFVLGQAYRARGTPNDALTIYQSLATALPDDVRPLLHMGETYLQLNNLPAAREAFNKALALKPDNVSAVNQLTMLDIRENKNLDAALARLEPYVQKYTNNPLPYMLLAKVLVAQQKPDEAILKLEKAVQIEPQYTEAQESLIRVYILAGRQKEAVAKLEENIKRNPKDTRWLLNLAVLQEREKDFKSARRTYENILKTTPNSVPALNNLANVLAEQFNEVDSALEYAAKARELAPTEAAVLDTYGWVLCKKRDYQRALAALVQSTEKLAGNPDAQYHLGMAQYFTGAESTAIATLELAVNNKSDFPGKDNARNALTILKVNPSNTSPQEVQLIRDTLQKQPWDYTAQLRLAQILDSEKQWQQAAQNYEDALKLNPRSTIALSRLADLNCFAFGKPERGLEYAKQAWNLSQDSSLAVVLGPVGCMAGDFKWASPVLSQARRAKPNDTQLAFYQALTMYGAGNISLARAAFAEIRTSDSSGMLAGQALPLLDYQLKAGDSARATGAATAALKIDANFAPALVVNGLVAEEQKDLAGARARYEQVLKNSSGHIVAQRQLGLLLAEKLNDDQRATQLLTAAKTAIPVDSEVTKSLGKIAFRRAEYSEAARLLRDARLRLPNDADVLYHLGLAQFHLNDRDSKDILARALALDSNATMAASARKALEELNK